jgi:hypothetical protein
VGRSAFLEPCNCTVNSITSTLWHQLLRCMSASYLHRLAACKHQTAYKCNITSGLASTDTHGGFITTGCNVTLQARMCHGRPATSCDVHLVSDERPSSFCPPPPPPHTHTLTEASARQGGFMVAWGSHGLLLSLFRVHTSIDKITHPEQQQWHPQESKLTHVNVHLGPSHLTKLRLDITMATSPVASTQITCAAAVQ